MAENFNVEDFINELLEKPNYDQKDYDKLSKFEDTVNEYIESHKEIPDEYFGILDDITCTIFENYQGINEIMYEVALDLDLIQDNDEFDDVDAIFGKMEKYDS